MAVVALLLLLFAPPPAAAVPTRAVGPYWRFSTADVNHRSLLATSSCDVSNVDQTGDGCNSGAASIDAGSAYGGVLGTFYWKQVRQGPSESSHVCRFSWPCMAGRRINKMP